MCLGVPGRITRVWTEADGRLLAEADFVGEVRTIRLNYLPDLGVGDHTIVHAGYALTRLTPEDAAETIRTMRAAGLLPAAAGSPAGSARAGRPAGGDPVSASVVPDRDRCADSPTPDPARPNTTRVPS